MFTITASRSLTYLRPGQNTLQTVLSAKVESDVRGAFAPLALGIALDRSGSMEGAKFNAAREGTTSVIQALDETMTFLVVTFNDKSHILFGPAQGTPTNKQRALAALRSVSAGEGTRMSTALNTIVDAFGRDQTRVTRVLFLTDGKNEGEQHHVLHQAVKRCAQATISVNAWGVGTDWDAAELRQIAQATHGSADIIPTPQEVERAFLDAFSQMRQTALTNARLILWTPAGASVRSIQQVYPSIVTLGAEPEATNTHQQIVSLGAFTAGEQRDYLIELEVPVSSPGQQFVIVRPGMKFSTAAGEQEEKSARPGWVFVEWTEDLTLAAQIDQEVAHYTHQEELAEAVQAGQAALAAGDKERATLLLGKALDISQRTKNEQMTKLLGNLVQRDSNGTVKLNPQATAVARQTLAIKAGETTRLH
jgi:hypothetical protein